MQILDEYYMSMLRIIKKNINYKQKIIEKHKHDLEQYSPLSKLSYNNKRLSEAKNRIFKYDITNLLKIHRFNLQEKEKYLYKLLQVNYEQAFSKWQKNISMLESLSPLKVLSRGYGLVCSDDGNIITSVHQVTIGQSIKLNMKDGSLNLSVNKKL